MHGNILEVQSLNIWLQFVSGMFTWIRTKLQFLIEVSYYFLFHNCTLIAHELNVYQFFRSLHLPPHLPSGQSVKISLHLSVVLRLSGRSLMTQKWFANLVLVWMRLLTFLASLWLQSGQFADTCLETKTVINTGQFERQSQFGTTRRFGDNRTIWAWNMVEAL